jgi:16S rRNA (cytidine1402-2'-O)-methyltransferase
MKNQKPTNKEQPDTKPALVLIATPIGNLEDISSRAVREMRNADLLCCEDTRRTGKLLELLEIHPRPDLLLLNEHTEQTRSAEVIKKILNGQRVALVSDAGLPGISDPGEHIVSEAIQQGVVIEVIPGPSAGITALVASGLPTKRFVFQGFIPRKGKARNDRLGEIAAERKTTIIYESGNRLQKTIEDLLGICDKDREVTIAKELTKMHEEYIRGTLCELQETLQSRSTKGEYVLVIGGLQDQKEVGDSQLLSELKELHSQGKSNRDAVNEIAKKYNVSKRRVYGLSIERT